MITQSQVICMALDKVRAMLDNPGNPEGNERRITEVQTLITLLHKSGYEDIACEIDGLVATVVTRNERGVRQ